MSEARAITNVIGNAVATVVVAKSENAFDETKYRTAIADLSGAVPAESIPSI